MQERNCPNCGAPLEADICKCPYCGTSYFDISAISIGNREPFYLKLKLDDPVGKGYTVITAYVVAEPNLEINCGPESTCIYEGDEYRRIITPPEYQFHMGFRSVYKSVSRTYEKEHPIFQIQHIEG